MCLCRQSVMIAFDKEVDDVHRPNKRLKHLNHSQGHSVDTSRRELHYHGKFVSVRRLGRLVKIALDVDDGHDFCNEERLFTYRVD